LIQADETKYKTILNKARSDEFGGLKNLFPLSLYNQFKRYSQGRLIVRQLAAILLCFFLSSATVVGTATAADLFGGSTKPEIGDDARRFTIKVLQGADFDLGPHLGKNVIMMDFWSIYCVSCVQELPKLVEIHNKYADKGLTSIGIDLDSFGAKRVEKFIKGLGYKIPYPIAVDKRREVAAKYGVSVLPTTILIDSEGKVVFYHVGYSPGDEEEIEKKVAEAISALTASN